MTATLDCASAAPASEPATSAVAANRVFLKVSIPGRPPVGRKVPGAARRQQVVFLTLQGTIREARRRRYEHLGEWLGQYQPDRHRCGDDGDQGGPRRRGRQPARLVLA